MKKTVILAAGAVPVAAAVSAFVYVNNEKEGQTSFFKANVEALANEETGTSGISGKCRNFDGLCLFVCPSCDRKWEGMRYDGPAYDVTGVCICGAPVGQ